MTKKDIIINLIITLSIEILLAKLTTLENSDILVITFMVSITTFLITSIIDYVKEQKKELATR